MIVLDEKFLKWNTVPRPVKIFLLKAIVLLVTWKLLYLVFLLQPRVLDGPLTYSIGTGTAGTLNMVTSSHSFITKPEVNKIVADGMIRSESAMGIFYKGREILSIADVCNGLELLALYAGFIICFPASLRRKILFISFGFILIWTINVLRCAALTWMFIHQPAYADFSHHYVFKIVVYGFIFLLWMTFVKKETSANLQ